MDTTREEVGRGMGWPEQLDNSLGDTTLFAIRGLKSSSGNNLLGAKMQVAFFRLTSGGTRHHVLLPPIVVLIGLVFGVATVFDLWHYYPVFISLYKESHLLSSTNRLQIQNDLGIQYSP